MFRAAHCPHLKHQQPARKGSGTDGLTMALMLPRPLWMVAECPIGLKANDEENLPHVHPCKQVFIKGGVSMTRPVFLMYKT